MNAYFIQGCPNTPKYVSVGMLKEQFQKHMLIEVSGLWTGENYEWLENKDFALVICFSFANILPVWNVLEKHLNKKLNRNLHMQKRIKEPHSLDGRVTG